MALCSFLSLKRFYKILELFRNEGEHDHPNEFHHETPPLRFKPHPLPNDTSVMSGVKKTRMFGVPYPFMSVIRKPARAETRSGVVMSCPVLIIDFDLKALTLRVCF